MKKTCKTCSKQFDSSSRSLTCSDECKYLDSRMYNYTSLNNFEVLKNAFKERTNCDICKLKFNEETRKYVDHCHETNTFRGILCMKCNTGLGLLGGTQTVQSALNYLRESESESPRHEICRIMEKSYTRGWISSRDGNASILKDGTFYITPSGVTKYNVSPADVLTGRMDNQNVVMDSTTKPSGEFLMHLAMYSDPSVKAVLHLHPTYTIAALHRGFNLQDFEKDFAEINRFMRVGFNVPNVPPISKELADATKLALLDPGGRYDIVGQVAHGVCSIGSSLSECFEHIERLEHICQIVLASGVSPK